MTPSLGLRYSSSQIYGELGVGWSLEGAVDFDTPFVAPVPH